MLAGAWAKQEEQRAEAWCLTLELERNGESGKKPEEEKRDTEGPQPWNTTGVKGAEGLGSCTQSSAEDEGNRQAKSHGNRKVIRDFQRKYDKKRKGN